MEVKIKLLGPLSEMPTKRDSDAGFDLTAIKIVEEDRYIQYP